MGMALREVGAVHSKRSAYRMLVHTRERRSNWLEHTAGRSNTREEEKEWAAFMEGASAVQGEGLPLAASTTVYSYAGCPASEKHGGQQPVQCLRRPDS